MNVKQPNDGWLTKEFFENRRNYPPEKLMRYAGQHIAWSWDGHSILAGDPDEKKLTEKLRAAGYDLERVVFSYVDDPNVSNL